VESEQPGTEINYFQEQQRLRKQPFKANKKSNRHVSAAALSFQLRIHKEVIRLHIPTQV
jgi:hypothetical protein